MRIALISKTFVADTAQRQLEFIAQEPGVELTLITPQAWRMDDGDSQSPSTRNAVRASRCTRRL